MHIVLIGKSFSGIKQYLSDHGHDYTVLQDKAATKFPDKKFKHRVVADFSDTAALFTTVDAIHAANPVHGLLTTYENYILSAARIARHLGLPGISEEAALACTDKELMRELFMAAPEKISPDFSVVASEEDVRKFADTHPFPLILKPANLSKSLLVTKSNTLDELVKAYHATMKHISTVYAKYAPDRTPKLLIEEFLEGPIFSVDAFVDAAGEPHVLENVVDYQTGYDIGFADNFHYSRLLPSRLPYDTIQTIRHTAAVGCKALGMMSSPAHVEIILTNDGPRIVEIGARNGGYRERMHWLANGIDITANALALSLDRPLDLAPKKQDFVGVFELFPQVAGLFKEIANEDELRKLSSSTYISIKAKPGQYVGKASEGYKMCAVVILHTSNAERFMSDMAFLNTKVRVLVDEP